MWLLVQDRSGADLLQPHLYISHNARTPFFRSLVDPLSVGPSLASGGSSTWLQPYLTQLCALGLISIFLGVDQKLPVALEEVG